MRTRTISAFSARTWLCDGMAETAARFGRQWLTSGAAEAGSDTDKRYEETLWWWRKLRR